ncbi:MAG TPA: 23S rRNA pseudouridylate synthase, partial [Idiomarina sp.]|nr:23S rRNA pseudouridylate synthase [Idiomarina sp.]
RPRPPKQASDEFLASLRGFSRQALHAAKLSLHHPITGDWMSFEAPRPDDFVALIQSMKDDLEAHSDA